jgi:hypothetical protein
MDQPEGSGMMLFNILHACFFAEALATHAVTPEIFNMDQRAGRISDP